MGVEPRVTSPPQLADEAIESGLTGAIRGAPVDQLSVALAEQEDSPFDAGELPQTKTKQSTSSRARSPWVLVSEAGCRHASVPVRAGLLAVSLVDQHGAPCIARSWCRYGQGHIGFVGSPVEDGLGDLYVRDVVLTVPDTVGDSGKPGRWQFSPPIWASLAL